MVQLLEENPLACAVAKTALEVVIDENLSDNANLMGIFLEMSSIN